MNRHKSSRGHNLSPLGAFLLFLLACPVALGQSGASTVRGTVTDQKGDAVAGATVTLVNTETNTSRTQTASDAGTYVFDLITPGQYRVEAEATGFKKVVVTDVVALVAKPTEVNVALEVGNVAETVTVAATAGEVLINTQDASIGNNFVAQQITQLPLEARNVASLLTLQPGVTREGYVTGARADQSNVTLDGVDVNEQQTNQIGGAATGGSGSDYLTSDATEEPDNNTVLRLNAEAIEEFRVVTSNPNASFGRSSGAQISLITKSGTNDWHGSLFEYHRNTVFTANDFFNNSANVPRPKLIRNTFGGALGGPLKRDRLFFFYSYEGRRDASERSVLQTVPLPSLGRGEVLFPDADGNIVTLNAAQLNAIFPQVGLNPAALSVLAAAAARYPSNSTEAGDELNTAGFRFNAPVRTNLNAHVARFDAKLTESGDHMLFARVNLQQDLFGEAPWLPDAPAPNTWSHPWGLVFGHTWAINNTMTNIARYGLTRQAFSAQGDAGENTIFFRFVFSPLEFSNTLSRVTPTHNFADDFSWIKGDHAMQFGTNLRVVRNRRFDFQQSFDSAVINPFFYQGSGRVLSDPIIAAGFDVSSGFIDPLKTAVAAVIGRYSDYGATFNFDLDGNPLPVGAPNQRTFATEEYDVYGQDVWKIRPNLTLTYGLRYGVSKPVYETQGFMVTPNIPLGEYLDRRLEAASRGQNYTEPIILNLAGEQHGRPGFYETDWNNFQPRVAVAWSPDFKGGILGALFGSGGRSVIRGGFAMVNDYFGQQLAVQFNANNELGFSSADVISANTYNVTTRPAPLFTGFGQDVRSLPFIEVPGLLTFPQQRPSDGSRRIESSLDSNLVSPIHYTWNASYGRSLPGNFFVEASYVGRAARNLLIGRDAAQPNLNLTDPTSGMTWRQAAGILEGLRRNNTPLGNIPTIPFFENLWPAGHIGDVFFGDPSMSNTQAVYGIAAIDAPGCDEVGGCYANGSDWTFTQDFLDSFTDRQLFFQPQYGALSVFSTAGSSDYHAGTVSVRHRFADQFSFDFNYTLSKSVDIESNTQTSASFTSFVFDALDPEQQRSVSDFDVRHIINANWIWQLPFGRNRAFFGDMPGWLEAVAGGWQLSGIFRWNSGLPVSAPLDFAGWPTNWNRRSMTVLTRPLQSSPTRGGDGRAPNLFADPRAAWQSFRSAAPGESGSRNVLRYPGYVALDAGLGKSFTMPWSETHRLQIRWDVFNVTNTQRLTAINEWTQGLDPQSSEPIPNWGDLVRIQGTPRVMQFGFRYSF
jgi:Carboxypeptidase regulatory-like domain